jgi:hypothetical protein
LVEISDVQSVGFTTYDLHVVNEEFKNLLLAFNMLLYCVCISEQEIFIPGSGSYIVPDAILSISEKLAIQVGIRESIKEKTALGK